MPSYTNLIDLSEGSSNQWIVRTKIASVVLVPIDELTLELQQRVPEADNERDQAIFRRQQEEHIKRMVASLERNEPLDPVTCVLADGRLHLVDGYHRVQAAKEFGRDEIFARVVKGNKEMAERLSFEFNHKSQQLAVSRAQTLEQMWRMVRKYYDPEKDAWTECGPAEILRIFGKNTRSKTTIYNMRDKVIELGKEQAMLKSWKEAKNLMSPYEYSEEQMAEQELQAAEEIYQKFSDPVRVASVIYGLQQMMEGKEVTVEQLLKERESLSMLDYDTDF